MRSPTGPIGCDTRAGAACLVRAPGRGGARADNLCVAAAVGDLTAVRTYFDKGGDLRADIDPPVRIGADGPELAPGHVVEYALIWAAAHDRPDVVEYLLTRGPRPHRQ
jgi:hypothetical protein